MKQLPILTPTDRLVLYKDDVIRTFFTRYQNARTLRAFCTLFLAYAVGAILNHFASPFITPAIIWLPAGIALAMLFLEGVALWPAEARAVVGHPLHETPVGGCALDVVFVFLVRQPFDSLPVQLQTLLPCVEKYDPDLPGLGKIRPPDIEPARVVLVLGRVSGI